MDSNPGGVKDMQVQDVNTIVDLKVQLARIEEALQTAQQMAIRIVEVEAELKKVADVAHDAKRNAADALSRLDKHDAD